MFGIDNYFGFILAAVIMNISPGADSIYIVTRSVSQGWKAGMVSVLGIGSGVMIHIILAALGLSTILAKSILIFNFIKWIGATYLIYLGIKTLLDKSKVFNGNSGVVESVSLLKIYKQGLLTNLLNPKVALFFLSLIPQFINAEFVNSSTPFLILGFTFLFTGMTWCFILAFFASFMTNTLRKNNKIEQLMKKISGIVFIALGIQLWVKKTN